MSMGFLRDRVREVNVGDLKMRANLVNSYALAASTVPRCGTATIN